MHKRIAVFRVNLESGLLADGKAFELAVNELATAEGSLVHDVVYAPGFPVSLATVILVPMVMPQQGKPPAVTTGTATVSTENMPLMPASYVQDGKQKQVKVMCGVFGTVPGAKLAPEDTEPAPVPVMSHKFKRSDWGHWLEGEVS